jgi:hypothetical protein
MTKKHFIALADLIKTARVSPGQGPSASVSKYSWNPFNQDAIEILADWCETQNPQFKRDRWIGYIKGENGKNGGKVKQAA